MSAWTWRLKKYNRKLETGSVAFQRCVEVPGRVAIIELKSMRSPFFLPILYSHIKSLNVIYHWNAALPQKIRFYIMTISFYYFNLISEKAWFVSDFWDSWRIQQYSSASATFELAKKSIRGAIQREFDFKMFLCWNLGGKKQKKHTVQQLLN